MATKTVLTLAEKIDRAKDGRTQKWIVNKMREAGCGLSEAQFTRKKMEDETFTEKELNILSTILSTDLNQPNDAKPISV